jgi:hypothetical protein
MDEIKLFVRDGRATAGSVVAGHGADRDRMTRWRTVEPRRTGMPANLDQGLGQECACDERLGRLNRQGMRRCAARCSRVGWSSQPITTAAT